MNQVSKELQSVAFRADAGVAEDGTLDYYQTTDRIFFDGDGSEIGRGSGQPEGAIASQVVYTAEIDVQPAIIEGSSSPLEAQGWQTVLPLLQRVTVSIAGPEGIGPDSPKYSFLIADQGL